MCANVLVAEDDVKQAEIIGHYLVREGHAARLIHDGRTALEEIRRRPPDLLVLDVMMPSLDGLDICRILRADPAHAGLPVLMLTARTTEEDLLLAFDLGADEYVAKPYSPRELMARIRNLLKRVERLAEAELSLRASMGTAGDTTGVLTAGAIAVDPRRHTVTVEGRPVLCTAGEFDLLAAMAAEPGRVFTRRQLLAVSRGTNAYITERTVDVHVLNLRKKIETDPRSPVHLLTVYKVGYKLNDRTPAGASLPSDSR
ncbi:response regulator transcription factor [Streptomyces sp. KMM 9044]|uniref:response regulator transcription factor n=1 Tax=Streptomyces sp. KMM 9044 TaxID=2744474 RepID=UPI0021515167|nr:response regulator transcription factor [Streptomyces sp. KMM 9044]WAX77377.1 response regulator transcription factor [Streptomyces sp. KMM 9044]